VSRRLVAVIIIGGLVVWWVLVYLTFGQDLWGPEFTDDRGAHMATVALRVVFLTLGVVPTVIVFTLLIVWLRLRRP
jgi:hypothetical protein